MSNKDIAPRFKRNLMAPASQPSVEELQMRPTQNSLLYKASQAMKQQQPLPMQPPHHNNSYGNQSSYYGNNNSGGHHQNGHHHQHHYGNNTGSGGGSGSNQHNYHSGSGGHGNQSHHQPQHWNRNNPSPPMHNNQHNNDHSGPPQPLATTNGPTLLSQTKSAAGKPMAVVAPTTSTPINNIMKKEEIIIKTAGSEKQNKKEKKDKGPNKEEFTKKVSTFMNETILDESIEIKALSEDKEKQDLVSVDEEIEERPKVKTMEEVVNAFMELKVPDKFMKDSIIKVINEILDKNDAIHERTIEFLATLRKENRCTNNVICEAFKHIVNTMNEKEKTIPKITTIVASLLSKAVCAKISKLSDIAAYTESGQHYPLFLLVLQQLHKKMGKQPLIEIFNSSKVNLMASLPEIDRTKDRMAEILEDRNLSFLYPLLRVQAEMWKQIQSDSNPQQFYKWIKENIESNLYTDTGFITAIMTVIAKFVTKVS